MNKTVLIVEDEPSIAENVMYALKTEGFTVIWHSVGEKVVELLGREHIDLIVLDVGLPDINGFELCKTICRQRSTPIIFLTARSNEIDRVVGLEIGADDYIVKPFSPRELTARVKAVLRRTRHHDQSSSPAYNHNFILDTARQLISYYGQTLDLSRYEFLILKTLINRPGQVYSRAQLMELLWDEPGSSLDRTIDAHIKNIRAKLKKIHSSDDPIKTHRGMGYSLKESM